MRRSILASVMVVACAARAQAPPVVEGSPSYLQRCFGYPARVYVDPYPHVYFSGGVSGSTRSDAPVASGGGNTHAAVPVGSGHSSGGGGGGQGGAEAALVLAVVVIAALPVIVYALDEDADQVVRQRFECPVFTFEAGGGTQASLATGSVSAAFTSKLGFTFGNLGLDWRYEAAPLGASLMSTRLLFLANPKQHVEGGLGVGWRGGAANGVRADGVEVGLPHRYVFVRDGLRSVALELEPALIFGGNTLDGTLSGRLVLPLAEWAHLRGGARVFSLGQTLFYGLDASLALTL